MVGRFLRRRGAGRGDEGTAVSIDAANMKIVKGLCQEVCALISIAQHEMYERGSEATYPYPSKTTGELRRRSMDLTRALADLRRS